MISLHTQNRIPSNGFPTKLAALECTKVPLEDSYWMPKLLENPEFSSMVCTRTAGAALPNSATHRSHG